MTDEREAKMEALRARVKAKKEAALSGGIIEEELVVSTEDLPDAQSIRQQEDDEWYELMDLDADPLQFELRRVPGRHTIDTATFSRRRDVLRTSGSVMG